MKKLLLITYYYWPDHSIGAIRPTKICKYLSDEFEIDVLTVKRNSQDVYKGQNAHAIFEIAERKSFYSKFLDWLNKGKIYALFRNRDIKKTYVEISENSSSSVRNNSVTKQSFLRKIISGLYSYQVISNDRIYFRNGKKMLKRIMANEYDVVISEFPTMSDHGLAWMYKKKHPKTTWIADFRDPAIREESPLLVKTIYKYWLSKINIHADFVVSVNNECLKELAMKKPINVSISNGFDADDFKDIKAGCDNDKMTITYTGTMYPAHDDLTPLFRALSELNKAGELDVNKVSILYMGHDGGLLKRQATPFGLETLVNDFGVVSRKESLSYQKNSDVLLLASWNTSREKGVVTGKFFEYLANRRPILAFVSGDAPDSLVHEYIARNNLGFCYEETNAERDYLRLKLFLKKNYDCYLNTGICEYQGDENFINSFSYDSLVFKWKEMINSK